MLEELLGGGHSSPPANNSSNTQPTTQPSSPSTSEPASGTSEPVKDEMAEDDMPADQEDGTYAPAPVTDGEAVSEPVSSDEEDAAAQAPDHSTPPSATVPAESDDTEDTDQNQDNEPSTSPAPVEVSPVAPPPSSGDTAPTQPEAITEDGVTTAAATAKADPVTRITDLIAGYEKLLSEPAVDETGQARTRAMELAQNRVLTSLLGNLSSSDARLSLLDEGNDPSDQVSLINKYYAEAGR